MECVVQCPRPAKCRKRHEDPLVRACTGDMTHTHPILCKRPTLEIFSHPEDMSFCSSRKQLRPSHSSHCLRPSGSSPASPVVTPACPSPSVDVKSSFSFRPLACLSASCPPACLLPAACCAARLPAWSALTVPPVTPKVYGSHGCRFCVMLRTSSRRTTTPRVRQPSY